MQTVYLFCRRFFLILLLLGLFRLPILSLAEELSQEDPPVLIVPTKENLNLKDYKSHRFLSPETRRK